MMAATAVSAAGSAFSGISAAGQASYASRVASNNAILSREQATDAQARGDDEQQRKWREISQMKSAQIAQLAASGFDTSSGSAADLIGDTAVMGTEDARLIAENTGREVRGFHLQAQNFQEEARAQRRRANQALVSTVLKVGSDVLGGASQLQGLKLPTPSSGGSSGSFFTPGAGSQWASPYMGR